VAPSAVNTERKFAIVVLEEATSTNKLTYAVVAPVARRATTAALKNTIFLK
jgi:hypothetical protein